MPAVLQVEWQNTSAFVSKHFRELLYLLDPVLRAWSPYLPQVTVSVWRSLITWLGPLSGSRLRLVLAMMQQSLPDKQRLELSILEIDWVWCHTCISRIVEWHREHCNFFRPRFLCQNDHFLISCTIPYSSIFLQHPCIPLLWHHVVPIWICSPTFWVAPI